LKDILEKQSKQTLVDFIAECAQLYKRKSAFVDEINQMERELGYEAAAK